MPGARGQLFRVTARSSRISRWPRICSVRTNAAPSESDINLLWDVYVYDRAAGRTIRASGDEHEGWMESSRGPSLDETGRLLTLTSRHPSSPRDESNDEVLFVVHLGSR